MASIEGDLNHLNNLKLDGEEEASPAFHMFSSLSHELQVLVYKHVCAPTNDRHNEGGDGFVHYLDYWHSGRRSYTSLYSTLMNQCADARSQSHPGRKSLLRTCRLAPETSLLAWRKDIMTSSILDWAALEDQLKIRNELIWQVDFYLARTRRTPPSSFSKFLELPFDLQYHVWRMTAASESFAKKHDMPTLLDDLIRQRVPERP